MKVCIITLLCATVASAAVLSAQLDAKWGVWKKTHDKVYGDIKEEGIRRYIWEKNQAFVEKHNYEWENDIHTFRVGMNKFADMDSAEFKRMFLGGFAPRTQKPKIHCNASHDSSFQPALGKSVDWRKQGIVTPVKNQGQCGSCWAFSTTGSIEGAHAKATGQLVSLSEQNLMDCSKPEGDFSCEGGLMDFAFDYVMENGGIDKEDSYPYEAKDENTCKFSKQNIGATISGCVDVKPIGSEAHLKEAVGKIGPVSVAIDASRQSFQLYESGVYYEEECSSTQLDHGVLAVGYGSDEGGNHYWIVKNSWGKDWGMGGYIQMSRGRENNCGIATSASYPVV